MKEIKKISVVIPIYNEAENIRNLYHELKEVLLKLCLEYEIVFIDDYSTDYSWEVLKAIYEEDKYVQLVSLLGNQGQTTALNIGFKRASGDLVIAMDGDGQHNPQYIPEFIEAIKEGYDLVSSWKYKDESCSKIKFIFSNIAHKIIGKISGIKMRYFGATMKAYRKDILENLDLSGDLHRFAGALVYFKGMKIKEIPIEIRSRKRGKSNYGISKIAKVFFDLILIKFLINYSKAPFRIFAATGIIFNLIGIAGTSFVFIEKYWFGAPTASNASILILSAVAFIIGIQLIFFGLMAEMISKIYYTSGNKNFYRIRKYLKH